VSLPAAGWAEMVTILRCMLGVFSVTGGGYFLGSGPDGLRKHDFAQLPCALLDENNRREHAPPVTYAAAFAPILWLGVTPFLFSPYQDSGAVMRTRFILPGGE
jgi:hypothetical protein